MKLWVVVAEERHVDPYVVGLYLDRPSAVAALEAELHEQASLEPGESLSIEWDPTGTHAWTYDEGPGGNISEHASPG